MWKRQSGDLTERQREVPALPDNLLATIQGSIRRLHNGTSFGLSDLEDLMNVAF